MASHHNRRNDDSYDHQQQQPRARFNKNEFQRQQAGRAGALSVEDDIVTSQPLNENQRQPRHDAPRENRPRHNRDDAPRDKKFHAEMVPLRDFEQMLRDCNWVTDVDSETGSFHQIAAAQKAQTDLYYTAYRNGAKHMEAWYRYQVKALNEKIREAAREAAKKERDRCEAELTTGDEEFDEFARQVRAHDWFYQYSDDGGVFRRGADNHERLETIAKERGGIYLKYFAYYPTRLVKLEG